MSDCGDSNGILAGASSTGIRIVRHVDDFERSVMRLDRRSHGTHGRAASAKTPLASGRRSAEAATAVPGTRDVPVPGPVAGQPRVLLFSSIPRSHKGGVQAVMQSIETELGRCAIPRLRIGPDEQDTPWTLRFAPTVGAASGGRPALRALPGAASSLARLVAELHRFRPDVVNVHFATGALVYFLLLRRVFGYRLILSLHGSDLLRPRPNLGKHLPRFLRASDAVTVVSDTLARVAVETAGPDVEIVILPNGVDTRFWRAMASTRTNSIVAAGRLDHVKGFDVLINAMARVPDAHLDIYGEGPERRALEALSRDLGVADRVRLPGHANRETLRRAFSEASVLAMPSRSEGMPLTLLEAMACGLPPVASAVGGVPEIVTQNVGRLVPPEDPNALAEALGAALAEDAGERRRAARERVGPLSADAMVEGYLALYARRGKPK